MGRSAVLVLGLGSLVGVLFIGSLLIGPSSASVGDSLNALVTGQGGPLATVMREIRLPRALLGVMIGGALGLSGAAMQGYLRNPLADPGLIGVSGSAALGAVLAIQTGLAALAALALPAMALGGALLGVLLVPSGHVTGADPRWYRNIGLCCGIDLAGAEPVAEPLCGE